MHTVSQQRYVKRTPDFIRVHQTGGEAQHGAIGYSYLVTPYGEHDVKLKQMFCLQQDMA